MTFMMTSSNEYESYICQLSICQFICQKLQFFLKAFSILLMQYMYKISCKTDIKQENLFKKSSSTFTKLMEAKAFNRQLTALLMPN